MALKLKAYTLFESVVAMLIIVTVFAIATSSIVNISDADDSYKKVNALFMLEKMATEMKKEKNFIDGEEIIEGIHYTRKAEKHPEAENLIILDLQAKTESGELLFEHQEMVLQ